MSFRDVELQLGDAEAESAGLAARGVDAISRWAASIVLWASMVRPRRARGRSRAQARIWARRSGVSAASIAW